MKTADSNQLGENKRRRLAYIKSLFRIGVEHLRKRTESDVAVAVLLFDNSLEAMFWLLKDTYDLQIPNETGARYSWRLLSVIGSEMKKKKKVLLKENESGLIELHLARNGVQHNGIIPTISSVERFRATTEMVLSNLAADDFGISWNKISMSLLIDDPVVRELYLMAEKYVDSKQYVEAAQSLVATFEFLKRKEIDRRFGSGILEKRWAAKKASQDSEDPHVKRLADYTLALEKEIEILKLGVDYKCYQKYRDVFSIEPFDSVAVPVTEKDAEAVLRAVQEKYGTETLFNEHPEFLQEWLIFAFEFVIDNAIRWQSTWRLGLVEALSYIGREDKPPDPMRLMST